MIIRYNGYEPYRSRPPTKGACREGPIRNAGFRTQNAASEAREACMVPDAFTALAVKRRWGENAIKRPRDNIIYPEPGPGMSAPPECAVQSLRMPVTGCLYPEWKVPPRKPRLFKSRDWITYTCAGETMRKPDRLNHTSRSPQIITVAKKRHRWVMPFSGHPTHPAGTTKPRLAQALIFHIKAKDRLQAQKKTSRPVRRRQPATNQRIPKTHDKLTN